MSDFNIGEALAAYLDDPQSIQTLDVDPALQECENDPEALTPGLINGILNGIADAIGENPETILQSTYLDSLQFLLKQASHIPPASVGRILELVTSALSVETDLAHQEQQEGETELTQHKQILEVYAFLLQWSIAAAEVKSTEKTAVPSRGKGAKGGKSKSAAQKDGSWDPSTLLKNALDTMSKVMKLKLAKFFVTTSERDTFIGLFTRPTYLLLENETWVKSNVTKSYAFRVLCIAVKHHGHAFGAQTSVIQSLTYFEHLSEPMAEFVNILAEQYDHPQLAEEVMRDLASKEFSASDTKGPKSVSTFVTRLSELAPRVVQRQVASLAKLLESENYALRSAIIEVCGNLIIMLSNMDEGERREEHSGQIEAFFEVLEEHLLDVNPYCRSKVLQVYLKLCSLDTKHRTRRQAAARLAAQSLEDKSSHVRRNAVKLLAKMMETHPFSIIHGGKLALSEWQQRLGTCEKELEDILAVAGKGALDEQTIDSSLLDEATRLDAAEQAPQTEEELAAALKQYEQEKAIAEETNNLKLKRLYYSEAITFIEILHEASIMIMQLLSSKNKSEVIEAMDFFVSADAFGVEMARKGIRKMMRLIWTKGNSDEGKGVQTHLIECYKGVFFTAPTNFKPNEAANFVARNMMSLTYGCSPAELTSLEQLLSTMMKEKAVNELVVQKLWAVYGNQRKESSRQQRRGAIMVLGMLALADPDIVVREMETCLRIGLGNMGRHDLILARYTCIALRRMTNVKSTKGTEVKPSTRLPNDHAVITRLAGLLEIESDNKDWYGMAEQAIGAIYSLSKHPEEISSNIIQRKTKFVFARRSAPSSRTDQVGDDEMDVDEDVEMSGVIDEEQIQVRPGQTPTPESDNSATALAQLLFTVGHIALKQIVHLELCEQDFKRRRSEKEKATSNASPAKKTPGIANRRATKEPEDQDELDLITGSTEDDFADTIAYVREHELLHGEKSILLQFGPLVTEICRNNTSYPNAELQVQASLCMAKFMCVSSRYCETNLDLLITILERSPSAIVRSNLVVALGDMAVCFNHLIDENTDYLYRRLRDENLQVKRTCLMTLTFLILAGQVKVKGQLGEMAKCVVDDDEGIMDLSRMFFAELAGKDNAIYNHFIDMFSLLSSDENLNEDNFKKIMKFLTGFIEKDKHSKQLAQKLAPRLQRAENKRQWNDVASALNMLPHKNDDIGKLVAEGFKVVETEKT